MELAVHGGIPRRHISEVENSATHGDSGMTRSDSKKLENTNDNDALHRELAEFVDQDFYYATYPDVREAGMPAHKHFIQHGLLEKRKPNAWFDPIFCERQLPDLFVSISQYLQALRDWKNGDALTEEPEILLSGHDGVRQEPRIAVLPGNKEDSRRVVAWYLPQFHPIGENDLSWGRGFTEWSNVAAAKPRFDGHYQPRLPGALGFYDLRRKETLEEQICLARHAGIYGFCLHHYWFSGKKILRVPLEHWRNDPRLDFPFCLHWANEPWTRRWDGSEHNVIIPQQHSLEDSLRFIQDIEWALKDPRYMRFQGKPMLGVYRAALFGDIKASLEAWRKWARTVGIGDLFLFAAQAFDYALDQALEDGFDGMVEFPPHADKAISWNHLYRHRKLNYFGAILSYAEARTLFLTRNLEPYNKPVFRGLVPDWDNSARSDQGRIYDGASPEEYGEWLESVLALARRDHYTGEKYIFINAWNEWAESAYLEPDAKNGFAALNVTASLLDRAPRLPHALFVCDVEEERQSARLEALLRQNLARPIFRPLVYVPKPVRSVGSFKGLAPVFASFDGNGLRSSLSKAGVFSWTVRVFLDADLAAETGQPLWPAEERIFCDDAVNTVLEPTFWRMEATGEEPAAWELRREADGRRVTLAAFLRQAAAVEERPLLSALVLPSQSDSLNVKPLRQTRQQAAFAMEILMTDKLARNCRERFASLRGLPCPSERAWLNVALREAQGEFIWCIAPEDKPSPNLPSALLPAFVDEKILCVRSYAQEADDCVPQIFTKHSYRLKGVQLATVARAKKRPLLPTPTFCLFRRSALLEALEQYHGQSSTALALDMLRELAQSVYEKGDVGLVPARLVEYVDGRK